MEPIFINEASIAALTANATPSTPVSTISTPSAVTPSLLTPSTSSSSSSSTTSVSQVNVHPVVLFSILDQYIRREAAGDKVIGTL